MGEWEQMAVCLYTRCDNAQRIAARYRYGGARVHAYIWAFIAFGIYILLVLTLFSF